MELVHEELSYKILGVLFEVNKEVGYGHREKIYQKAIAAHLRNRNIPFREQVEADLIAAGEKIGSVILDFLVEDRVVLEIKASNFFVASDFRQVKTYLQTMRLQLAILATFSPTGVRHQRIVNLPDYRGP